MCIGHQKCTRCGREAPGAAWKNKHMHVRDAPTQRRQRSASRKGRQDDGASELARLRKSEEKLRKEKELLEQQLSDKAAESAVGPETGEDDPKAALRKKIAALRADVVVLEGLVASSPAVAPVIAQHKLEIAAIHAQMVEGQPINLRVKNIELHITRREKAREKLAGEMVDLETEQVRIMAELQKKRGAYVEILQDMEKSQAERADLLHKKALEAGAPPVAAAPVPPATSPADITYDTALTVLLGFFSSHKFSDAEREGINGVAATRARIQSAAAVPVPACPTGTELYGEAAAAGRDEHSQAAASQALVAATAPTGEGSQPAVVEVPASIPAGQPEPPTQPTQKIGDGDCTMGTGDKAGSIFDKAPPSAAQAMADIKRQRCSM